MEQSLNIKFMKNFIFFLNITFLPSILIQETLYYHCTVQNGTEVFSCLPKADSANMMIPGVQIVLELKAKHEYQIDRAGLM